MKHSEIVSFLWGVADLIRDTFKRGKYQDIILPLTVLRRLDCVLSSTKEQVLAKQAQLRDKGLQNLERDLRTASGFAFYNTSRYDFEKLLADAPHLATNLRNYIVGFSANIREVLEKFDFDNTISKPDESGLLFQVLERFKNSVRAFFDREVKPHVPDAWIETGKRDLKDGRVGIVGYEINFNRYFYRYKPPPGRLQRSSPIFGPLRATSCGCWPR